MPSCGEKFLVHIATVRAKTGRTQWSGEYTVRTITRSGEDVIRFTDYSAGVHVDLRSRDIFYLCYKLDDSEVASSDPSIL